METSKTDKTNSNQRDVLPWVSIIVPCYNGEKTIKQTLESAVGQDYQNVEVLVIIDESSTDNTLAKAKEVDSDKIKIITVDACSPCRKRNLGFERSRGQYIQYLDADDLLSKDKISKQVEALSKTERSDVLAVSRWMHFDQSPESPAANTQYVYKDYKPAYGVLVDMWLKGEMIQTSCWLTSRELVTAAGPWNEDLEKNPNDDGEFFCRVVLKASELVYTPEGAVLYRRPLSQNASQSKSTTSVESILRSYQSYEAILDFDSSERTKKGLSNMYLLFIYNYFNNFPKLAKEAEDSIKRLGINGLEYHSGGPFDRISQFVGFKNALRLRKLFRGF
ncbi:MAG: glycosyltransferase family 2 protein [Bacteroidia bacterium]|nr:glycosyltransferase family 2 protein [Bacteroidia bacterium]